jgi:hypothetical protein
MKIKEFYRFIRQVESILGQPALFHETIDNREGDDF